MNNYLNTLIQMMLSVFNAAIPIVIKMLFTLLAIKFLSVSGEAGVLTSWGYVQNIIGIACAIAGLSVQSGISSGIASGYDPNAFKRALLIPFFFAILAIPLILIEFVFELSFIEGVSFPLLISGGVALAISTYFTTFLPVTNNTRLLTLCYFLTGSVTLLFFILLSPNSINSLLLSYTIGLTIGVVIVFLRLRKTVSLVPFNINWSGEKLIRLCKYGAFSLFNTIILTFVYIYFRSEILEVNGPKQSDIFEAGLRIIAIAEASIGAVLGLMLWKDVGKHGKVKINFILIALLLGFLGVFTLYLMFNLFDNLLVQLVFSVNFLGVVEYLNVVFFIALLKIVISMLVMPLYLNRKIIHLVAVDIVFLSSSCLFFIVNYQPLVMVQVAYYSLAIGALLSVLLLLLLLWITDLHIFSK